MIKDKNIILRPLRRNDLEKLVKWETPEIRGRYQEFHFKSIVNLENKFNENGLISDDLNVLIVELNTGVRIGLLFINFKREGVVNLGLVITRSEKRGQGLGKKILTLILEHLFNNYPLVRVEADTDVENEAAQKVLSSVGFKNEGRLRNYRFHHGSWHDSFMFSITNEEYKEVLNNE